MQFPCILKHSSGQKYQILNIFKTTNMYIIQFKLYWKLNFFKDQLFHTKDGKQIHLYPETGQEKTILYIFKTLLNKRLENK